MKALNASSMAKMENFEIIIAMVNMPAHLKIRRIAPIEG
jgi:hypothetical protein